MNKVQLQGVLTRNPYINPEESFGALTIQVNPESESDRLRKKTLIDCIAFYDLAGSLRPLRAGEEVFVSGKLVVKSNKRDDGTWDIKTQVQIQSIKKTQYRASEDFESESHEEKGRDFDPRDDIPF